MSGKAGPREETVTGLGLEPAGKPSPWSHVLICGRAAAAFPCAVSVR